MHQPPSPRRSRGAVSTAVLLVAAAVLVAAGTIVLLAGFGSVGEPAPGTGDTAASGTGARATATPGASPSARPATAGGDPILVGAGDIGRCDAETDDETASLVDGLPGMVFVLGDNAYEHGSPAEYRDCFGPSWGRLKDRITLPVPGNHDYETDGALGYREYFVAAAVPEGLTWYSRDVGRWHVVVLDTTCNRVEGGCGPGSPQLAWLEADLAASTARCTLALFHHPRFSSGEHGSDTEVAPIWDALYAAGADLVLNGHEHSYERFAPQDPSGRADPDRGITEIIVGTGGAALRGFHDPVANSRVRASLSHGVLSLTLGASGWGFRFQSVDGSFTDEGRGTCH